MSRNQRQYIRRTTDWRIFSVVAFGLLVLTAPSARAELPPRKKPADPVLKLTTIDNEGPISFVPIMYARRHHERRALHQGHRFEPTPRRAIVGPPPRTTKTQDPRLVPTLVMGPLPRR